MNNKTYEMPEAEIILFENEDVITTSNETEVLLPSQGTSL